MKLGKIIEQNELSRLLLLKALYEFTCANTKKWVCMKQLGERENITNEDFQKAYDYLIFKQYIKPYGAGYTATITHFGIAFIESQISNNIIISGQQV